jgi:hypothetical protein
VRREVQNRVDTVGAEHFHHEVAITDFANDERRIEHSLAEPSGQIVQHHYLLTPSLQLQYGVASNVSGAAGD